MKIEEILQMYEPSRENLLAVLHKIQDHDPGNHVSGEAMIKVAAWMKIPVSSVYGVLKYYSMYSTEPRAKHLIRICNSVVCSMKGAEALDGLLKQMISGGTGTKELEGMFTLEFTECLGNCESAPVMMVDEDTYGPIAEDTLSGMLKAHLKRREHGKE
jgi:NADH-quinone oxidoreductase subunit E